jgi:hypothetical protein
MEKISSRLQERIDASPPGTLMQLIVTLSAEADWGQGLEQLKAAGMQVESEEEAVQVVFGRAPSGSIAGMASLPSVALVELDARAQALH